MNEELHNFKAGALLPGLQAVLSGAFFSLLVMAFSLLAGTKQAGVYLLAGGACAAFITWLFLLRHWLRLVDFNAGLPAQPEFKALAPAPSSMRIELVEQTSGGWQGAYVDLPATPSQVRLLASGVVQGASLSESAWTGANRPFTKAQFHALRQACLERGWLAWRNQNAPAQGVEVTSVGRRVFSLIAEGRRISPIDSDEPWR